MFAQLLGHIWVKNDHGRSGSGSALTCDEVSWSDIHVLVVCVYINIALRMYIYIYVYIYIYIYTVIIYVPVNMVCVYMVVS